MRGSNRAIQFVIATGVALVALSASADGGSAEGRAEFDAVSLTSPWRVVVGGTFSSFNSRAAWAPAGVPGATIELEDVLGLDEDIGTWRVAGSYRFNRRHSVELRLTDLSRSAARIIEDEIEWGDVIYRANARVESTFDFSSAQARWRYDFSDSGRLDSGLSLGLSTFWVSVALAGEGRLENDDETQWVEGVVEEADVLAPIPVVGFFMDYGITPRWTLRVEASAMNLDVSDHSGRVVETGLGIEYLIRDVVGVGLALETTDIEYRQEKQDERLGVDYRVSSVGAYLSFSF